MSKHDHMPPVPPANRSHKGTGDNSETANEVPKIHPDVNTLEQGGHGQRQTEHDQQGLLQGAASQIVHWEWPE